MCLILHLNNHTWKKDYKINFLLKKMRPKSVVLLLWKKLQILEKKFFQLICADMAFKTVCRIFFK